MTPSQSDIKLILAYLSLPVHRSMMNVAISCANQVATRLSFTEKECFEFQLSVEEDFCNVVDHFSSPNLEGEQNRAWPGDYLFLNIR